MPEHCGQGVITVVRAGQHSSTADREKSQGGLSLVSGMLCRQHEAHRETSRPTHEEALVLVAIALPPCWSHATHRYSHVHPPCEHQQSRVSALCMQQKCFKSRAVHTAHEVVLGTLLHVACLEGRKIAFSAMHVGLCSICACRGRAVQQHSPKEAPDLLNHLPVLGLDWAGGG